MLDTNTLSDLVRNPDGIVKQRIASLRSNRGNRVAISIVVAAEARFGVAKNGSSRLTRQVETILASIDILSLQVDADKHYARIRAELEKHGTIISANDLLIAAHALASDSILVTNNVREFSRVRGLRYENWLQQ